MIVLIELKHFFEKFISGMENIFFVIVSIFAFCIGYPAQVSILIACLALFVLDIITRFYAISIQNGGLHKAFTNGKLSSREFWNGFLTKALGYFVILTIANIALITPQLDIVGRIISTTLFCGLFFYEAISNMENLRDANFLAIIPFLNKIKKEQDKFFDTQTEEIKDEVNK